MPPRHIGIVACSTEGAALCYRTISLVGGELMGRHAHPELSLHSYPLSDYMEHIDRGRWDGVARLMLSSAEKLAGAGADFLICPDNTLHIVLPEVRARSPLPWLHIGEVVAEEAKRLGYRRLGVTGTRYTMEGPVYPSVLGAAGLDHRVPGREARERIDRIIFDELVNGVFSDESRAFYNGVIARLAARGCDVAALVCTEIPLLVREDEAPLPTLDSTRLLAKAALRKALV
jgi:aspartate racemase